MVIELHWQDGGQEVCVCVCVVRAGVLERKQKPHLP